MVYGPGNIRDYRYDSVVSDSFSNFSWTVPLKNKKAEAIKDSSENIRITLKRKSNILEIRDGKEFVNKLFTNLLNSKKGDFF